MENIVIREDKLNNRVVFGNFVKPLNEATQSELRLLAVQALKSGDQSLLDLFGTELPELSDLHDEIMADQA